MSKSVLNTKIIVNHWLQELGQKLDMSLCLDRDSRCIIEYKRGIQCCIEVPKNMDFLFIYSPLLPVPSNEDYDLSDFLYQAMTLNLFQIGTDGATLSIDPQSDYFVLCYRKPIRQMDSEELQILLAQFLTNSENIQDGLEEIAENCKRR